MTFRGGGGGEIHTGGGLHKKGGRGQLANLGGGLTRKRGVVFLKGVIPQSTL